MDTKELLWKLSQATGVSGEEGPVAAVAAQVLRELGETQVDRFSNVICRVQPAEEGKPHLLLQAHLDEIGMIVTGIDEDGFLKVGSCGGLDRRQLLATQVTVHGREELTGIVCAPPAHLEKGEKKLPKVEEIAVDIGFDRERAEALVSPGDRITVTMPPAQLLHTYVTGKAMDDRAGCVSVIKAAEQIRQEAPACGLTVLLSMMEEVGGQGAQIASYQIQPTHAIAVDVSFAKTHGMENFQAGELDKGPMIGIAPILNREMSKKLEALAKEQKIPFQLEVMGGSTGTDADGIAVSRGGIPTALLSIPQKYMHTPTEVVSLQDVENTACLMAAYARCLGGEKAKGDGGNA